MRAQDNGYDGPYEEVDEDQDGDYSCGGVGKESELGREARDEALDPLRPWEGEGGHREEEGSWRALVSAKCADCWKMEGKVPCRV